MHWVENRSVPFYNKESRLKVTRMQNMNLLSGPQFDTGEAMTGP